MNQINQTDNSHWEGETAERSEFASFNRLASMLISVPGNQIRAKLDEAKKNKEANATPAGEMLASGVDAVNHKDPD